METKRQPSEPIESYLAQYRDWGGGWCDDGGVYATAREARDECIGNLAGRGYSGVDVRVLQRTTARTLTVVTVPR